MLSALIKEQSIIQNNNDLPLYKDLLQEGQVYTKIDTEAGLIAIIAIHSLILGPGLGGCRFLSYPSLDVALQDAIRLAKGMSYKAAISQVPYGGGKAVILKPSVINDKPAFFKSFSNFVNNLNGDYITTMDSGLQMTDLDLIARYTPYITGHTKPDGHSNDPAPYTAQGVLRGIEAAVKFKWQRQDLVDLHVAIQGIGNVGYLLAKMLLAKGAKVTVCDIDLSRIEQLQAEAQINVVPPHEIYQVDCDIFCPCGLGLVLNNKTIPMLKASIVAGCANNQLASTQDGENLAARGILYAPDYVINAGGLIQVAGHYSQLPQETINKQVHNIYYTLFEVFERACLEKKSTYKVANEMAEKILKQ